MSAEASSHQPEPHEQELSDHQRALANREGGYDPGMHNENLYDQDEDKAGNVIDLRTGKAFDNSTRTVEDDIQAIGHIEVDGPTKLDEEDDEAARWLADHDEAA